jgi:PAS domain S-box-containing protein
MLSVSAGRPGRPEIPPDLHDKWHRRLELLASASGVCIALIVRVWPTELEVLVVGGEDGLFEVGCRTPRGEGQYCEEVIAHCARVHVVDATQDPRWRESPEFKRGLITCLGLPLHWPDGETFGSLCLMGRKPTTFTDQIEALLDECRETIETDLRLLHQLAQRQRIEQALRESEERLRSVVERMPVLMCAVDDAVRFVFWNAECERVTGYAASEIVGRPDAMELLYPEAEYRRKMSDEWRKRGNDFRDWPWSLVCKDGSVRTIAWSNVSAHVPVPGWSSWGVGRDVTEQEQADEALRYRARFEALIADLSSTFIDLPIEQIDLGIRHALAELGRFVGVDRSHVFLYSADGRLMSNTHEWCAEGIASMQDRIQDVPAETSSWFDSVIRSGAIVHIPSRRELPPEASAEAAEWIAQSIRSLVCVPIMSRKAVAGFIGFESVRAEKRWQDDIISLLKIVSEMIGSVLEHKRVVQTLRENQRSTATLMSNLPGMAYRCRNDRDWTMEFVSEGCVGLTGYEPGDLVDRRTTSFGELMHADDRLAVWEDVQRALAERRPFMLNYRITTACGEIKWVWEQGQGVCDDDGELVALEGFIIDVTQRRLAEEAAMASERKLRQIIDLVPHFIFAKDRDGRFLLVNKAVADAYGTTVDQLTGTRESTVNKSPEELEHFRSDDIDVIDRGQLKFIPEETLVDVHGRTRILQTSKIPFTEHGSAEKAVLGVAVDITERKEAERERLRLEEQLRQSQKMEAVGTLASGVAHDFNNMITVILGSTEILKRRLAGQPDTRETLEMIERAVEQATGLTRSLLTFSRKVPTEMRRIDLREAVAASMALLRRALPATVEIVSQTDAAGPLFVMADATQLQQILLNLAINARDAMPRGGTLTLGVGALDDRFARITVTDTGTGIDSAIVSRIFEPFFTTKPRGQGTGLGLALLDSMVRTHGGRIDVSSQPGRGTSFMIDLPRNHDEVREESRVRPVSGAAAGRGETVLLVEDNEQVRGLVASMLTQGGYAVVEAVDGMEMFEVFQREQDRIRLMIVDIDLPRRSGLDCLRILRTTGITIPAIVITGTTDSAVEHKLPDRAVLVRKPFHQADLQAAVARMLADGPHG